jgi:hypothetical protein
MVVEQKARCSVVYVDDNNVAMVARNSCDLHQSSAPAQSAINDKYIFIQFQLL